MATLSVVNPTLADWAKVLDPDGAIAKVVEVLGQSNEILEDMSWIEGNLPTGHRSSVRTSLPSGTWRRLNKGVAGTKSTSTQITDSLGMLETYSIIDKDLADLNGNSAAFRAQEDAAFLEGINQQMATALFYGNSSTNPEQFMGLAPRYNTLVAATSQTANNVITGSGAGADNTSVWLIVWSPQTVHGIFPKGSKAGFQMTDKGIDTVQDGDGMDYEAYRMHYQWKAGLTVRDWRYVVRIANIDASDLTGGSPADLLKLMERALNKIPNLGMGRPAFYMNRTVRQWLGIQTGHGISTTTNIRRSRDEAGNPGIMRDFAGVPIRICDRITIAEAAVA